MKRMVCNGVTSLLLFSLAFSLFSVAGCGGAPNRKYSSFQNSGDSTETGNRRININTASESELASLPFIGPQLASDIVEFRTQHGPFRRVEHLMLIQGISEKRFRTIKHLIKAE
jgi:competence protein ComEA